MWCLILAQQPHIQDHGWAIAGGLLFGFVVSSLLGAVLLRAASRLYNILFSDGGGVEEPSFGYAFMISCFKLLAVVFASAIFRAVFGPLLSDDFRISLGGTLLLGLFVESVILTEMLPAMFHRAFCVAGLNLFLSLLLIGIAGAVYFMVSGHLV